MKKYLFVVLIVSFLLSCRTSKFETAQQKFSFEKLCNKWLYVNSYDGIITNIDTLKKKVKKYKYFTPFLRFNKDSTYTNYQGDYQDNGTFSFDEKSGIIKKSIIWEVQKLKPNLV